MPSRVSSAALMLAALSLVASACQPESASPRAPDDASDTHVDVLEDSGGAVADDAGGDPADSELADAADALSDSDASDAWEDVMPCDAGACPDGFQCYTVGCLPYLEPGEPCVRASDAQPCRFDARCVTVDGEDRCVLDGTENGICRYPGLMIDACRTAPICDAGLGCDPTRWAGGHCRPALHAGSFCALPEDVCNEGSSCVEVGGVRRCVADGELGGNCRPDFGAGAAPPGCETGLRCATSNASCTSRRDRCTAPVALGDACDWWHSCPGGSTCVGDGLRGVCVANGDLGSGCESAESCATAGASCLQTGPDFARRCAIPAAEGDGCDLLGLAAGCGEGSSCTTAHELDPGVCAAAGTAPGSDCRREEEPERCDPGLECSLFSRYRQTCRRSVGPGEQCDLGAIAYVCPDETWCVPVGRDEAGAIARCLMADDEVEPNDRSASPALAFPGAPSVVRVHTARGDEDCAAAELSVGDALYVELTHGWASGWSPEVSLYGPDGVELGRWAYPTLRSEPAGPLAGVVRLEPSRIPALVAPAAGRHSVCIRDASDVGTGSVMTLAVFPAL